MTDREYEQLLTRAVKGAEYLDNPLIKSDDWKRGMKLYDAICEEILQYKELT
ncbi:hypothetical protein [Marininema halotolerans]|uniref:Uncharacterized protein n=1 Tax=Marininema halotolerans TaxID=1155944 RepID=A0A1I6UQP6_9BACL|nr:hypothetical protein [Marininema halotolerans]SFT03657.1 hypothetical protein SAMN05444972_1196 [Marininema halotolerans]